MRCPIAKLVIGCGYLGRRIAEHWRTQGHAVHATTRRTAEAEAFRALGLDPIRCDVLAPECLKRLPPADTVVYAVGFDRGAGPSMRAVYVEGLARVLDQLARPKRFIYVSSSSVYGQTDGGWVDEDAPTEPQEESGQIVLDAEGVLRTKLPSAVILRFAGIYGPGRLLRRQAIEKGEPIVGDADKWLNLIHVADGVRAVLAAEANARPGGTYNVCDDEPVQRRAFYAELARVLRAPPPSFVAPPPDRPAPPHEKANRRIRNARMKGELRVALHYPNHVAGLAANACP